MGRHFWTFYISIYILKQSKTNNPGNHLHLHLHVHFHFHLYIFICIYIYIYDYKISNTTLGPTFFCRSKLAVTRRSEVVQQYPPGEPNLSTSCVDLAMPQGCRSNFENRKNLALHPGERPKILSFGRHEYLSPNADVENGLRGSSPVSSAPRLCV